MGYCLSCHQSNNFGQPSPYRDPQVIDREHDCQSKPIMSQYTISTSTPVIKRKISFVIGLFANDSDMCPALYHTIWLLYCIRNANEDITFSSASEHGIIVGQGWAFLLALPREKWTPFSWTSSFMWNVFNFSCFLIQCGREKLLCLLLIASLLQNKLKDHNITAWLDWNSRWWEESLCAGRLWS